MKKTRKQQKVQTRQSILATAKKLISENGFAALKTLDVARESGIAHGTIFIHFPTRDNLITEAIEAFGKELVTRLHDSLAKKSGVKSILKKYLKIMAENESFYEKIILENSLLPSQARDVLLTIQSGISFHLYQAAESELKNGKIKKIPMHLLFNTWMGLIHYYISNRELFSPGRSVINEKGDELINHFMNLISNK